MAGDSGSSNKKHPQLLPLKLFSKAFCLCVLLMRCPLWPLTPYCPFHDRVPCPCVISEVLSLAFLLPASPIPHHCPHSAAILSDLNTGFIRSVSGSRIVSGPFTELYFHLLLHPALFLYSVPRILCFILPSPRRFPSFSCHCAFAQLPLSIALLKYTFLKVLHSVMV